MHKAKAALRTREHARAWAGVDACALAQVSLSLDEARGFCSELGQETPKAAEKKR